MKRGAFFCLMMLVPVVGQADSMELAHKTLDDFAARTSFVYNPPEAFDEIYCSTSETGMADGDFGAWLSESQPTPGGSVDVSVELTDYVYDSHAGAQDLKVAEVTVWGRKTDPLETVELLSFDVVMDVPYFAEATNGLTGERIGAWARRSLSPDIWEEVGSRPSIPGYLFTGWTGLAIDLGCVWVWDDSTVALNAHRYFITYGTTTQCRLTAHYAVERKLTTSSTEGGSVTVPGEGTYSYGSGSRVTVGAMPEEGYRFSAWTGTAVTAGKAEDLDIGCAEVTMDADYTMVAHFSRTASTTHTLSISSGAGGSVTSPGEGSYTYTPGSSVPIAAAAQTDYEFAGWTGTAVTAGKVANSSAASTTVTMDGDYTVVANFSPTTTATHTLDLSSGTGGSVTSPGEGTFAYAPGASVSIVAAADSGYEFSGWSGTAVNAGRVVDSSAASTTVTVDADYTLRANFASAPGSYTLSISAGEGGSVTTPGEGSFAYGPGATVSVQAGADSGYDFAGWSGTAVNAGKVANAGAASTTVVVDDDYTLVANFQGGGHTLDVSTTTGGWVITPGEGSFSYSHGESVTLEAQAQVGYYFVGWSGSLCSSSYRVSIEMNSDHQVTANFAPNPQTLTVSSGVGGSVVVPGEGVFSCASGDCIRAVAVPDAGYGFAGWSGDLVEGGALADPNAALVDCVLEADATLRASFAPALQNIYVDDDALGDPAPGEAAGSDPDEDGTWDHPFDTIQEGIEAAEEGQAVLVWPGTYYENVDFLGKGIVVSSLDPHQQGGIADTVIYGGDLGRVVTFQQGEGADSILLGFTIVGGYAESGAGIWCDGASPIIANCVIAGNRADMGAALCLHDSDATLANCTIADNYGGIDGCAVYCTGEVTIVNSIIYKNTPKQIVADPPEAVSVTYSDVRGGWPGLGNSDVDSCFTERGSWVLAANPTIAVFPNNPNAVFLPGDYHLASQYGRWDPVGAAWVQDSLSSPCIDAGNPQADIKGESVTHGGRVNAGAFGGTVEASQSPGEVPGE